MTVRAASPGEGGLVEVRWDAPDGQLLGTIDDGAPRLFQDVADVAPGTVMEYRAVVRDADDRLSQTVVSASVGDDHGTGAPLPTDGPPPLRDVTVSVAGTMNPAMGCSAAWMPACDDAVLSERAGSVFSGTWTLPAGDYEYKVAVDQAWFERRIAVTGRNSKDCGSKTSAAGVAERVCTTLFPPTIP